jgi:uncharacterized membrane protein YdjX (TVP38/TMEM64 family)
LVRYDAEYEDPPMFEDLYQSIQNWGDFGVAGLLLLGAAFVVASLTFVPRPAISLVGGLAFGFAAVPVAFVGYTVGAIAAFLIARRLLRARVVALIAERPKLRAIMQAIDAEGWRLVGLIRIASPIPGSATSYLTGVTGIGLWPYAAATFVGSAPQILTFVSIGALGHAVLDDPLVSRAQLAFLAVGIALFAAVVWLVARRARAMLAASLTREADAGVPGARA